MADFELGLRKALKNVFTESKVYECFFHYVKNLWEKVKIIGLFKKSLRKYTCIIIFAKKLYPYVPKISKKEFINAMEKYITTIKEDNNLYKKFFK